MKLSFQRPFFASSYSERLKNRSREWRKKKIFEEEKESIKGFRFSLLFHEGGIKTCGLGKEEEKEKCFVFLASFSYKASRVCVSEREKRCVYEKRRRWLAVFCGCGLQFWKGFSYFFFQGPAL